jgi:tetratricopeptide (TPR) repeat protein
MPDQIRRGPSSDSTTRRFNPWSLLLPLLLIGITWAAFWPVLSADFISYDDPLYVAQNPHVSSGLTWENIKWAFSISGYAENWFPLTWISHMLDVEFYGVKQAGLHHMTNLIIHSANVVLLFFALRGLTAKRFLSTQLSTFNSQLVCFFVAALFAIHPLHVESVAWIAERKDVLSGFFFMLTLLCYAKYAQKTTGGRGIEQEVTEGTEKTGNTAEYSEGKKALQTTKYPPSSEALWRTGAKYAKREKPNAGKWMWYFFTLAAFACGLMSKPMLVTVPFVLLLLDFWPLGRMVKEKAAEGCLTPQPGGSITLPGLVIEKFPFFLLTIASCLITMRVQVLAMVDPNSLRLPSRLANALFSYCNYLGQAFWPTHMAIFYPYEVHFPPAAVIGAVALLLVITALAVLFIRRAPFVIVGWFWFIGMLVPTIGIVQVGSQCRADRYTYLPLIGIFIAVTGIVARFCTSRDKLQEGYRDAVERFQIVRADHCIFGIAGIAVLIALGVDTWKQTICWQDDAALFGHAAKVTEQNFVAWGGLGIAEAKKGNYDAALADFKQALAYGESHGAAGGLKYYIGFTLQLAGKPKEALNWLQESTPLPEQRPDRSYRIGLCLVALGRLAEAVKPLKEAAAMDPRNDEFQFALASVYQKTGNFAAAEPLLRNIIERDPRQPNAHRRLGDVLLQLKKPSEAAEHYATAMSLAPPDLSMIEGYAESLAAAGRSSEAATVLSNALKSYPQNPILHYKLAQLQSESSGTLAALDEYQQALSADPSFTPALNDLAWIYATDPDRNIRDGKHAVELATKACDETKWKEPMFIGTLAAAYAEAGNFPEAIKTAEKARDLARTNKMDDLAKRNEELLELYKQNKAYHEPK